MSEKPSSFRSKLWFIACSLCLLMLLVTSAGLYWWARRSQAELDRYKAQLISQGEVLDIDQLAPIRTGKEPDGDGPLLTALNNTSINPHPTNGLFSLGLGTNQLLTVQHKDALDKTTASVPVSLWQQAAIDTESQRLDDPTLYLAFLNPPKEKGGEYRVITNYPNPDYVKRRMVAAYLHSRIICDTHASQPDWAFTNLVTLLNLAQFHREEWLFINQMIRNSILDQALRNIHYGLAARGWIDPQLLEIQDRVQAVSILTNTITSLVFQRAKNLSLLSEMRHAPDVSITLQNATPPGLFLRFSLNQNELGYLGYSQRLLEVFRQQLRSPHWASAPTELRTLYEESDNRTHTRFGLYNNWLIPVLCPDLSTAASNLARTETLRQQTITALALERHRLKHGSYPDKLEKLIPDFLQSTPQDPMDGHPLRYRLEKDGTFTLWSVGFDGQDNGGDPTTPAPNKQRFPSDSRDLVWPRLDPLDLPPNPQPSRMRD